MFGWLKFWRRKQQISPSSEKVRLIDLLHDPASHSPQRTLTLREQEERLVKYPPSSSFPESRGSSDGAMTSRPSGAPKFRIGGH